MATEVNEMAEFAINDSSNLSITPIALNQKLERFDMCIYGVKLMSTPIAGKEIFNAE